MSTVTGKEDVHSSESTITGLTAQQVAQRVARGQTNAFEVRVGRTYRQIIQSNVFNIFNILLFVLLLIVLISQDYATVAFAGFSVVGNTIIGTIQEIHAKRKLDRMAHLADRNVEVIRDGERVSISSHDVVLDDVMVITPGVRLVADGEIIRSDSLEIDESHLTGESEPAFKSVGNPAYSGSFCVAGAGLMVAKTVGRHSTVNRLSTIARVFKNVLTPTQQKIAAIVQITLLVLAVFAPMVFISSYIGGASFLGIIRNTVVFVTSLVPQGLILVTTISLTIGAVKISRHQTLIQRINAVESLANVTALCFDKTGTITHNQLAVADIIPLNNRSRQEIERDLCDYVSNLSHENSTAAAISRHIYNTLSPNGVKPKEREIPFTSKRQWGAIIWNNRTLVLGAPERVLGADHQFSERVTELSSRGLRVVALASTDSPPDNGRIENPGPLALIAIRDRVRDDIGDTLEQFRAQNVKLKIISGDNLQTVRAVAEEAGLATDTAYSGDELAAMSDEELQSAVYRADIFARVEPDTKRRIVAALRQQDEYVAMVGDGVNDVPALKEADLAIVMDDGAQISKDVADIVLLNNALSTLPLALREGTEITQTIFGTTKMFLAKNLYNTLLFIFVLFMSLPFPITPIQISWGAFGTTNAPAGLMALGLLRPAFIRRFRDDVLDYIFTSGLIGAFLISLMYLVTYLYTKDVEVTRHALTIAFILFGLQIVWYVGGIDIMRPRTIFNNVLMFSTTTLISIGTLVIATLLPDLFEFGWPPGEILLLVVLVQMLCAALISLAMRKRGVLHQLYALTSDR
jgi:cation-transporting P-type ATPase E